MSAPRDLRRILGGLALGVIASACTVGDPPPVPGLECEGDGLIGCVDESEVRCVEGVAVSRACDDVCIAGRGCLRCAPATAWCEDDRTLSLCDAEGAAISQRTCEGDQRCVGTRCADLCGEAAARHDYAGCEYVAVPLANPQLRSGFSFAVVLANPSELTAHAVIEGGELAEPIVRDVAPWATEIVTLPWIDELSGVGAPTGGGRSALRAGGAYWVRSDIPVLASQWSPLEYRLAPAACDTPPACFSYTNDASLLVPIHALGASHHVMSFVPLAFELPIAPDGEATYPVEAPGRGLFAIVAVEPGDTVVTVHPSAPLEDPSGARIEAGEAREFVLTRGDVLQLLAAVPRDATECTPVGRRRQCTAETLDPTGTRIESSAPVAVFSGHGCAHVPFDRPACDHLEEQILPDVALGHRYAIGRTLPLHERPSPNLLRVLSVADDNRVIFDPPIHPEVVLDAGEHVLVLQEMPVVIEGSGALLVAQLTTGMEYAPEAPATEGDPSMVLGAPIAQWRRGYVFPVPGTYTSAYASIVAPEGTEVTLDGEPLTGTPVRFGGFELHDVTLATDAAVHRLDASAPVGLTLHGYAPWTSYSLLGGLTVAPLVE
jgi:hypothetical protein